MSAGLPGQAREAAASDIASAFEGFARCVDWQQKEDVQRQMRRLVMAPLPLVDYVIAHEVCHILEHNHLRRFWRSLETIMPDYEARVRQLDRMAHLFVW